MPRLSIKRKLLNNLEKVIIKRKCLAAIRDLIFDSGDDSSSGTIDDIITHGMERAYTRISNQRYAFPRKPYRKGYYREVFERDLRDVEDENGSPPWLTEDEFLNKYRLDRESFYELLDMIKEHEVFKHRMGKKGRHQTKVEYQLLVFLYYIGRSGHGASNPTLRQLFGIGRGTAETWKKRCCEAIRSLRDRFVYWPDDAERLEIAKRFYTIYTFLNCIAVGDGTLFPLICEPESDDAPDYHGRKFQYSLTAMIVNDDKKRIRYYLAGFPGSAHDNRVYRNTDLGKTPNEYFGNHFFLLADSAITNSSTVVASFKCPQGHTLTPEQERFNSLLGSCRVTSEHTIGILKGRFQFLRGIPMKVTNKKKSIRRILRVIDCCVILHNFLMDKHDEVPDEWLEELNDDDGASEVGAAIGEFDYSNPILVQDSSERRQRCIDHFKDMGMI